MIVEWLCDLLTVAPAKTAPPRETVVMSHNEAPEDAGREDLPSVACERCHGVVECGGWLFMTDH